MKRWEGVLDGHVLFSQFMRSEIDAGVKTNECFDDGDCDDEDFLGFSALGNLGCLSYLWPVEPLRYMDWTTGSRLWATGLFVLPLTGGIGTEHYILFLYLSANTKKIETVPLSSFRIADENSLFG